MLRADVVGFVVAFVVVVVAVWSAIVIVGLRKVVIVSAVVVDFVVMIIVLTVVLVIPKTMHGLDVFAVLVLRPCSHRHPITIIVVLAALIAEGARAVVEAAAVAVAVAVAVATAVAVVVAKHLVSTTTMHRSLLVFAAAVISSSSSNSSSQATVASWTVASTMTATTRMTSAEIAVMSLVAIRTLMAIAARVHRQRPAIVPASGGPKPSVDLQATTLVGSMSRVRPRHYTANIPTTITELACFNDLSCVVSRIVGLAFMRRFSGIASADSTARI